MEKTYHPHAIENHWYRTWETNGYFKPVGEGQRFCIMIPPPNVTGSLHMGHGFQEAIMDALIRYHRMKGDKTLWQVGTDHAGIATQMVVERQLEARGLNRHDLGRDQFIAKVWEWKEQSGGTITGQLRRLGASADWSRERFTMDPGFYTAVQEAFVRLYEDGLIYRGKRLVNWDPVLQTAVSDLEVVSEEEQGHLWHIRYPLADGSGHLTVATTRPETLLGDAAVAVHPEDPRYRHLVGKTVRLPLVNREIPIIADDYVDIAFGTGCVKITPAHDFNDYQVWLRHRDTGALANMLNQGLINIFDVKARIISRPSENPATPGGQSIHEPVEKVSDVLRTLEFVPSEYRGLDRFEARKRIVTRLEADGLLESVKDHKLTVPRGDRTGSVIEPFLTDQWYVSAKPLAAKAIAAVADGSIEFVPKSYENLYFSWLRDIQDWCISRQLWWGHRIPAWYDPDGKVYVGRSEAEVRAKYGITTDVVLRQDDDVLDTWFSSALWTFATLGWPVQTSELKTYHPTDVLVTGFDIIFFWVARMVMFTLHFTGEVPFRTVYVHGLVRDSQGQKMSKSKGNVLDPIDLIDGIDLDALIAKRTSGLMRPQDAARIDKATRKEFPNGIAAYGTDALRYTYYSLASTGRDIKFDVGRIQGFRNFCNKLWNATRYVLMQCESADGGDIDCGQHGGDYQPSLADRWIISRLQIAERAVIEGIDGYRFDLASQALYDFVWSDYCDWYLELSKPVLWDDEASAELKKGTRRTLIRVLEATLRLAHPLMPFITEEIWQRIKALAGKAGDTIMLQAYPVPDDSKIDLAAVADIEWLKQVVVALRNIRGEMNVAPGKLLSVYARNGGKEDRRRVDQNRQFLAKLASLTSVTWLEPGTDAPAAATALAGTMEILVPLAGLIDKSAELDRLGKELAKLSAELQRLRSKLENAQFVDNAPPEVVAKERKKAAETTAALATLNAQRGRIERI